MKKIIFSTLLLVGIVQAQISLQNSSNKNLIIDMKQGITTGDKTFVLPSNSTMQSDRTLKTNVNTTSSSTLESGLLIYNNSAANGNDKGPYFWYNKSSSTGAWSPFVNTNNQSKLQNLNFLKNVTATSNSDSYSQTNNLTSGIYANSWINNIGDLLSDTSKRWQVLPGMQSSFDILNAKNIVSLRLTGFAEAYYRDSSSNQFSFDVGIFIDGKLAVYSPFSITTNKNRTCTYNNYNLVGLLQNLSVGTHNVQVAVKNRNVLSSTNTTVTSTNTVVTYNSRNGNCITSPSADIYLPTTATNGLLNIQIQENPSVLNN